MGTAVAIGPGWLADGKGVPLPRRRVKETILVKDQAVAQGLLPNAILVREVELEQLEGGLAPEVKEAGPEENVQGLVLDLLDGRSREVVPSAIHRVVNA